GGEGQPGDAEDPSRPRLAPVTTRDIVVSASAAGVIEPITLVEVKSKASGEIVDVPVDEGDAVRANQLLVRVDPRIPMNAVVQAEADSVVARAELDNADAQLERAETLHRTQAITDLEYEGAKLARATAYATLIRARRALEDAKIAYEDTEVRAPISGVILGRPVEVGTVIASASRDVSGGVVLLRMASLDTVQVRALVDETDIGMIRPGMPVTTIVAAYPNRPFRGAVLRIGAEAVVEQNVTMFPVLVLIENGAGLLRPGMNAEVEIHIGAVENALAVPNAALRAPGEFAGAAELVGLSPAAVQRQIATPETTAARPDTMSLAGREGRGRGVRGTGGRRSQGAGGRPTPRLFGGEYIVFVRRGGEPRAVRVQTGLTDFAYTAVLSGLTRTDSVYILPTAGLLEQQQRREDWIRRRVGGPLGQ
ncbi:MAG: efflux RND transporter periplasmic adaptor subunit, partial [Gemmatimonadales bacterium]